MRQGASGPVQEAPKHGQRSSLAQMQARVDALEAELKAAREREAATAEVLQVINASPGDLVPVFDAVLDRALRLCEAPFGVLFRYDGVAMHFAAMRGDMLDEVATEWIARRGCARGLLVIYGSMTARSFVWPRCAGRHRHLPNSWHGRRKPPDPWRIGGCWRATAFITSRT